MKDIKVGDVVSLRSETRATMTVTSIDGEFARTIRYNSTLNNMERDKIELVALVVIKSA